MADGPGVSPSEPGSADKFVRERHIQQGGLFAHLLLLIIDEVWGRWDGCISPNVILLDELAM